MDDSFLSPSSQLGLLYPPPFVRPSVANLIFYLHNSIDFAFYGSLLRKFPLATSESPFGGEGGKIRQVADAVLCLFIFLTQSLSSIKKEIES